MKSYSSLGSTTNSTNLSDNLLRYKARFEEKDDGKKEESRVERLDAKCVHILAKNFTEIPNCLQHVPLKYLPRVTRELKSCPPMDITIASTYIHDENYWKRCSIQERKWKNCDISNHGMMWKQLYFEKYLKNELESYDPGVHDKGELISKIKAGEDYVFKIKLTQFLSHENIDIIFNNLPNLNTMDLTYEVNKIGMQYERSLFGMKIIDANNLANCIKDTHTLTTLILQCNLLDDDLLRRLMTGLVYNNTITHLDLSHNKITNHGARMLAKLLGRSSVLMTLNLADNQIHSEGGRYLGKALKKNESLVDLNLRLNRLADEGGRALFEGLKDNTHLSFLNLSCNSLGLEAAKSFSSLLKKSSTLTAVDASGNEFNEEAISCIRGGLLDNKVFVSLDLRMNQGVSEETDMLLEIQKIVHSNETRSNKK